jgi:phage tail sheath gpL-like
MVWPSVLNKRIETEWALEVVGGDVNSGDIFYFKLQEHDGREFAYAAAHTATLTVLKQVTAQGVGFASEIARNVNVGATPGGLVNLRSTWLPQRIALVGQGNDSESYSDAPVRMASVAQALYLYGSGSPLADMTEQALYLGESLIDGVSVVAYPVQANPAGVAASGGEFAFGGVDPRTDGILRLRVGMRRTVAIEIPAGTDIRAVAGMSYLALLALSQNPLDMSFPAPFTSVLLSARWKGASGNLVPIAYELEGADGLTVGVVSLTGGLNDPDPTSALTLMGECWESMIATNLDDSNALDAFNLWGESRWQPATLRPVVVFHGSTWDTDVASVQAVAAGREDDRTNVLIYAPGSVCSPYALAARACTVAALAANVNPARDFSRLPLTPIPPGDALDSIARELLVQSGVGTVRVGSDELALSDVVTMYRSIDGSANPWSNVVDIVKLSSVIYTLRDVFERSTQNGAPLVTDEQAVTNPAARSPKGIKSLLADGIDRLAMDAILGDPRAARESLRVDLSAINPKRVDAGLTVQLSGSGSQFSLDLDFNMV